MSVYHQLVILVEQNFRKAQPYMVVEVVIMIYVRVVSEAMSLNPQLPFLSWILLVLRKKLY